MISLKTETLPYCLLQLAAGNGSDILLTSSLFVPEQHELSDRMLLYLFLICQLNCLFLSTDNGYSFVFQKICLIHRYVSRSLDQVLFHPSSRKFSNVLYFIIASLQLFFVLPHNRPYYLNLFLLLLASLMAVLFSLLSSLYPFPVDSRRAI